MLDEAVLDQSTAAPGTDQLLEYEERIERTVKL
jgi:hypothetical protein